MHVKSRVGNQFYATFCANLLCLGYGLATGWTSAAVPLLKSAQTPLKSGPISSYEASIIGSILTIGGVVGTLIFGYAANRIGRKKSIFLMAFPQIFGWILMFFAQNAWMLILFRFLAGIAAGGVLTVISGYTTEISADRWASASYQWHWITKYLKCSRTLRFNFATFLWCWRTFGLRFRGCSSLLHCAMGFAFVFGRLSLLLLECSRNTFAPT